MKAAEAMVKAGCGVALLSWYGDDVLAACAHVTALSRGGVRVLVLT